MGEFSRRISDGAEIKIGTCEEMLYLRFEDRHKVAALRGSVDVNDPKQAGKLLYRLPFPDEDGIQPGDYKEPFRAQRLYDAHGDEFRADSLADQPGVMQLSHKSGLLLNVRCYHGIRLPEVGPGIRAFWNGKSWSLELAFLRATFETGADFGRLILHPVIQCQHCRKCWRADWTEVIEYIPEPLRGKLAPYTRELTTQKTAEAQV
jgi:hypothetical protein